jgi:hypothetical protein
VGGARQVGLSDGEPLRDGVTPGSRRLDGDGEDGLGVGDGGSRLLRFTVRVFEITTLTTPTEVKSA